MDEKKADPPKAESPAAPKAAAAPPKKSPGARVWGLVATVIAAGIGGIALFWITSSIVPMIFSGITGTLSAISNGISGVGTSLGNMAGAVGEMFSGFSVLAIRILFLVFGAVLFGLGIKWVMSVGKSKGGH